MTHREGRPIDTYLHSLFLSGEEQLQEVKSPSPIKRVSMSGQGLMEILDGPIKRSPWNDSISLRMQNQGTPGLSLKKQSPCQRYFGEPSFENMYMMSRSTPQINEFEESEPECNYKQGQLEGLYQKVMNEYRADKISLPFFFDSIQEKGLTKLICFQITKKNSRSIVYDPVKMTCLPQFKCFGCRMTFQTPNGLGGHLSRCPKKKQHLKQLHRLSMLDENGKTRASNSQIDNKIKTHIRKSKRIGKKANSKRCSS